MRLIEETVQILKGNGAKFVRSSDYWPKAAKFRTRVDYLREFAEFHTGSASNISFAIVCANQVVRRQLRRYMGISTDFLVRQGEAEVFLQHDADRNPENTIAVMELEQKLGVTSSNYFFVKRASRYKGDVEPYELDLAKLKSLECSGFEIGYHLNGPELAGYDTAEGWAIIESHSAFFREHFKLRSFVPHGGQPGPQGENNDHIQHIGCLKDLVWAYNSRGIVTDITWSDGGLECPESIRLEDPRDVARRVKGHMRARFLFHPQYYGAALRPDINNVGVTSTEWWQKLWS